LRITLTVAARKFAVLIAEIVASEVPTNGVAVVVERIDVEFVALGRPTSVAAPHVIVSVIVAVLSPLMVIVCVPAVAENDEKLKFAAANTSLSAFPGTAVAAAAWKIVAFVEVTPVVATLAVAGAITGTRIDPTPDEVTARFLSSVPRATVIALYVPTIGVIEAAVAVVAAAACEGTAENPAIANADAATSAMRLKLVFVDIIFVFLSRKVDLGHFPSSAWPPNALS